MSTSDTLEENMLTHLLQRMHINNDADAEFSYWKDQFLLSVWIAALFAAATGAMIAVWPEGAGNAQMRTFARDVWTLFAELAFWFGFLCGLLWGAAKRLGAGLSGTLPWQPAHRLSPRSAAGRLLGQVACCFAFGGLFLLLTQQMAGFADAQMAALTAGLTPLVQACLASAAVLAALAIMSRERTKKQ
ncbi:hypothetical protein EGT07_03040 [Herbaspirillum sp. HC18]|nr:hypothetical protein EGT07_03040 [Herbaspirillum sp. HC18]